MVQLRFSGTYSAKGLSDVAGITDLQAVTAEGRDFIVSSSGAYGELAVWEWTGTGLVVRDTEALSGTTALAAPGGLAAFAGGGDGAFYSFGGAASGLEAYRLTATGQIRALGDQGAGPLTLDAVLDVQSGGTTYVFGADRNESGLQSWRDAPGGLWGHQQWKVGTPGSGTDVPDMATLTVNGTSFLLTVDSTGDSLTAHKVTGSGLVKTDVAAPATSLWVNTPVEVETAEIGGKDYAIVGASDSGTLSVLQVNEAGKLWVTDHVLDDRTTRFDTITALEVVSEGDRSFVLAAGGDDGITLMTLLPGGRLLELDTLASQLGASLEDITAIEAVITQTGLRVYASGEGFKGVAALTVDLGALSPVQYGTADSDSLMGGAGSDMIFAGGSNDTLKGGAGHDILDGGDGADVLWGGAGEDIFVFAADGATDRIADFELGTDRIDLSQIGRAYTIDAVKFETLNAGVRIVFNGEVLDVISADGKALTRADFTMDMLFDMSHMAVAPPPPEALHLIGGLSGDVLEGDALGDTIEGGGGADLLMGGIGPDVLCGDSGRADFDAASDTVVRLFQAILGRLPNDAGHLAWTAQIESGKLTVEQAVRGFMASAEFQKIYGATSNMEFVTLLFENVLGREPAQAGLNAWTGVLDAGTSREALVLDFANTAEFVKAMMATTLGYSSGALQAEWTDDVFRLFQATLGRAPAVEGLLSWAESLADGASYAQTVAGFVNSAEFQMRYGNSSNAEFVTLLFDNVLGRPPAQAGLDAWTRALDQGMSRVEAVTHFSQTAEFVKNSAGDLIDFMRTNAQDDTLVGGVGDDILFGGSLADTFKFDATQAGTDHIVAIEAWDLVLIENSAFADTAQLFEALVQTGDDVVLDIGAGRIVFADTELDALSQDMFQLG